MKCDTCEILKTNLKTIEKAHVYKDELLKQKNKKIEELVDALAFYANPDIYDADANLGIYNYVTFINKGIKDSDSDNYWIKGKKSPEDDRYVGGKKARTVLKKLGYIK